MTLHETVRARQSQRARRANRDRQSLTELRADEIASVQEVRIDYAKVDRAGDLEMETALSRLYQLADDDEERNAVARVYLVWQRAEQREEAIVGLSVTESVELLKSHNAVWLGEGAK